MMHKLLADARFYAALLEIDRDLARAVRGARCPCGGPLHASHYPRAPRGGPAALPKDYEKRFSFCCALEGCRTRATPPSVRFFGRRWYLAPVVVLVSALEHGVTPRRLAAVRKWLGKQVSRKTVERWRRWWQKVFTATRCWTAGRGRLVPPVDEKHLPLSLLERFEGDDRDRFVAALCFLSPVTTGSWARSLVGEARR
ncbi:MAG: hypothetical protein ACE5G2_07905 [Candidatus Krumholzibacteriia bacterium]